MCSAGSAVATAWRTGRQPGRPARQLAQSAQCRQKLAARGPSRTTWQVHSQNICKAGQLGNAAHKHSAHGLWHAATEVHGLLIVSGTGVFTIPSQAALALLRGGWSAANPTPDPESHACPLQAALALLRGGRGAALRRAASPRLAQKAGERRAWADKARAGPCTAYCLPYAYPMSQSVMPQQPGQGKVCILPAMSCKCRAYCTCALAQIVAAVMRAGHGRSGPAARAGACAGGQQQHRREAAQRGRSPPGLAGALSLSSNTCQSSLVPQEGAH